MTCYRIIRTVDILGDEEFFVIPQPSELEFEQIDRQKLANWADSPDSWDHADFTNAAIYASVEVIYVEV